MWHLFKAGILLEDKKTVLKNLLEDKDPPLFDSQTARALINTRMAAPQEMASVDNNFVTSGKQNGELRGKNDKLDGGKKASRALNKREKGVVQASITLCSNRHSSGNENACKKKGAKTGHTRTK